MGLISHIWRVKYIQTYPQSYPQPYTSYPQTYTILCNVGIVLAIAYIVPLGVICICSLVI